MKLRLLDNSVLQGMHQNNSVLATLLFYIHVCFFLLLFSESCTVGTADPDSHTAVLGTKAGIIIFLNNNNNN